MTGQDPLAAWRSNPFFVLEVSTQASRADVERAGQKLLGLLALGSASAAQYDTPFGPAARDADSVRQALATLRDPNGRVVHELWADRQQACPYVRHDERGCFCVSPSLPEVADRYMPCDTASLQLWCLTEADYTKCCLYPAGDVP